MIVRTTVKSIQDIMRQDVGVDGDAQRISQLCWMFFLKIFDDQEEQMELTEDKYKSPIPEHMRWRNWAANPEGMRIAPAIFFSPSVKALKYYGTFRKGGLLLIAFVAVLAIVAWIVSAKGELVAAWMERGSTGPVTGLRHKLAMRVREFRGGLNTIHGFSELVQLVVVSVAMWYVIALAYHQVILSYGPPLQSVGLSECFLLIFASMLGSLVQLPGVGGGSQLATISTLQRVFDVRAELAASCGILLWAVTFMSVVPLGLTLAHRERLSLRKLSEESQVQEGLAEG